MSEMREWSDFEVLKELVERGLELTRRGRSDETNFTHYILSVGYGNEKKSIQITRENWSTPAAGWAMRLLLDAVIKTPDLKGGHR